MTLFSRKLKTIMIFSVVFNFVASKANSSITIESNDKILEIASNILGISTEQYNTLEDLSVVEYASKNSLPKKDWTFIVYISGDNDLRRFAIKSIKDLAKVGSTEHINLVVHLDIKLNGKKTTKRYYIKKDKILHLNKDEIETQAMDSGNPKTLISFCDWAISTFPADKYGLVLWDHGTGALDPRTKQILDFYKFFTFNPIINKFEINRDVGLLDIISNQSSESRGICWDDSTGNYLTNHDLGNALKKIYKKFLKKKKFEFIAFDACLMQMVEVISVVKQYAHKVIGSEEVILGLSFPYDTILKPFTKNTLTTDEFSKQIAYCYENFYKKIIDDYTLSVVDVAEFRSLEENIDLVAKILIECLKNQKNRTVKQAVAASRNRWICTNFAEPSFIDLHHFYQNLFKRIKDFEFKNAIQGDILKTQLKEALLDGCKIIEELTPINVVGKKTGKARGVSIYFPVDRIYYPYRSLQFFKENSWALFLTQYLNL